MEAILLCGIQATGKSTFCRERLFSSHVRLNLDMLKTRHREDVLLRACIEAKQPFVIDNTNPKPAVNPKSGQAVTARRRRLRTVLDLPMRDDYSAFVAALLGSNSHAIMQ